MNSRKFCLMLLAGMGLLVSGQPFFAGTGGCSPSSYPITQPSAGSITGFSTTAAKGAYWQIGQGDPAVGLGVDNGGQVPWVNSTSTLNWVKFAGVYYLGGNWGQLYNDNCAAPNRMVLLLDQPGASGGTMVLAT